MSKRDETRRRWEKIVSQYERAGLSQAAFAAEHKVAHPALRYWIYKLRGEVKEQPPTAGKLRLLPIEVSGLGVRAIEVRAGQVSITLPAGTAAAYVAELVSALDGPRC